MSVREGTTAAADYQILSAEDQILPCLLLELMGQLNLMGLLNPASVKTL